VGLLGLLLLGGMLASVVRPLPRGRTWPELSRAGRTARRHRGLTVAGLALPAPGGAVVLAMGGQQSLAAAISPTVVPTTRAPPTHEPPPGNHPATAPLVSARRRPALTFRP
jgi:hypothetical protein